MLPVLMDGDCRDGKGGHSEVRGQGLKQEKGKWVQQPWGHSSLRRCHLWTRVKGARAHITPVIFTKSLSHVHLGLSLLHVGLTPLCYDPLIPTFITNQSPAQHTPFYAPFPDIGGNFSLFLTCLVRLRPYLRSSNDTARHCHLKCCVLVVKKKASWLLV